METPNPPFMTPPGASKQVAAWHPMTSQGFLGNHGSRSLEFSDLKKNWRISDIYEKNDGRKGSDFPQMMGLVREIPLISSEI